MLFRSIIYNRDLSSSEISALNTALGGAVATRTNATLTVSNSANKTFSGTLKDNISTLTLTKSGAGTLTLSGASTYTGGTTISNGIIQAGISSTGSVTNGALGTGSVTVSSGAALDLNTYTVANALSLSGTGYSSSGALYNSHASTGATASGNITLAAATTIANSGSGTLTL